MRWRMPGYGPPGGDALIGFNNQKGHMSVYIGRSTIDAHRAAVGHASIGTGCVRYADAARIDVDLLGTMLSDAFRAKGGVAWISPGAPGHIETERHT